MYQKTTLDNGVRVVTHDMKDRASVALGLWVGAGGRYEDDRYKGVAHFLEHILFKGSANYSCEEIKEQIEGIGGSLNAFTADEQTCYYAKIPARSIAHTFDILADMVFYPKIAKKDVVKEKGVILEEIKMYHDLPQYMVMDLLDGLVWPNHPLGKNLVGTPETIAAMSNEDLKKFHRDHYHGANVVVAACGQIRHEAFAKFVHKTLKKVRPAAAKNFLGFRADQTQPRTNFFRKDIEQMHLALGMLGLPDEHADKYALILLHIILGGNMSSRLFDEVREKRGLAYSISTSIKTLKDTGMFLVRAGVDNKKIVQAVDVILQELRKIKRLGISASEFKRAKEYYSGQVLLGLEDTLDHMLWIGESVIVRDRIRSLKEIMAQINKIKPADIKRLAVNIIREERFNLSVVGPLSDHQQRDLSRLVG